ncbi:MAG TPA: transcription elongation factor [Bryobacteraceae bacterium]|nr:transcription elongation factor [Bryobacteraceae bacterium]
MPKKKTIERAKRDRAEGKAPTTQAGEFVREEIEDIRQGKHGARSPEQAIAIGLSKARRAGVPLPPPKKGTTSEATRKRAERDLEKGRSGKQTKPSAKRSRARLEVLQRESRAVASKPALAKHAKKAAARRRARGKVTSSGSASSK